MNGCWAQLSPVLTQRWWWWEQKGETSFGLWAKGKEAHYTVLSSQETLSQLFGNKQRPRGELTGWCEMDWDIKQTDGGFYIFPVRETEMIPKVIQSILLPLYKTS